jgi:polyisoprenoid-binding protein YceI
MNPARALAPLILLVQPMTASDRAFTVDRNHTVLGFKAATPLFEVPGRFDRYRVDITGDPDAPAAVKVRVELDAASINTANAGRDTHLKSPDFFDSARFPKLLFSSDKAWREGDLIKVAGTLEIRGQKKELTLAFTPATGLNGAGIPTWSYRAALRIDRKDFGLGADSLAAKIGLKDNVDLDLLLVGFFGDPPQAPAPKRVRSKK